MKEADVVSIFKESGKTCIQVFFFRSKQNWGNQAYFPKHDPDEKAEKILTSFLVTKWVGNLKKEWRGKKIIADLDFSGEGLVYDPKGKEIQGITNASIWDQNFARTRVLLPKTCIKNNKVEIWVETAANSLFGIFVDVDPEQDNPKRHGTFDAKVETIDIGKFREDIWHLYLDVRILLGLIDKLEDDSTQRLRIINSLNQAVIAFKDDKKDANSSRKILSTELNKRASCLLYTSDAADE